MIWIFMGFKCIFNNDFKSLEILLQNCILFVDFDFILKKDKNS